MLTGPRVRIAIVNDFPVVVQGLATMLADDPRIEIVELDSLVSPVQSIDLALFDAFASRPDHHQGLTRLIDDARIGRIAIYTWNVGQEHIDAAMALGVDGYLSKALGPEELANAIVRIHAGELVVEPEMPGDEIASSDWPGRDVGLSPREAEVIAYIVQGYTNPQIAEGSYLSINSVKSYVRTAYRKMGVTNRSQAVLWGVQNGMLPRRERELDPEG